MIWPRIKSLCDMHAYHTCVHPTVQHQPCLLALLQLLKRTLLFDLLSDAENFRAEHKSIVFPSPPSTPIIILERSNKTNQAQYKGHACKTLCMHACYGFKSVLMNCTPPQTHMTACQTTNASPCCCVT